MSSKSISLILIAFIFILFISVYTLTRNAIFQSWDLSSKGQIGDAIGGITSPIINIIGSFLIFITFLAQNKANKIAAEQNSFALLHDLYKDLKEDFNALSFSSSWIKKDKIYNGKRALSVFTKTLRKHSLTRAFSHNSFFREFEFLLGSLSVLLDLIDSSGINNKERKFILRLVHSLYDTRISKNLDEVIDITDGLGIYQEFRDCLIAIREKVRNSRINNFPSIIQAGV